MTMTLECSPFPAFLSGRSHYAPSKSACTIAGLVNRAKEVGCQAFGIMDDDTIAGCLEFSEKAKKSGVKPICGVRLKISVPVNPTPDRPEFNKDIVGVIGLIALNEQGWKNMQWLVGMFHKEYRTGLPILALYQEHKERFTDLACLSGSIQIDGESGREGFLPLIYSLYTEDKKNPNALRTALRVGAKAMFDLKRTFSKNLYIEISRPGMTKDFENFAMMLADSSSSPGNALAPLIATPDVRYPSPNDHVAWRLIWAKFQGHRIRERALDEMPSPVQARYILTPEEMAQFYEDIPEAVASLTYLAYRANYAPVPSKPMLPQLRDKITGAPLDSDVSFREQSQAGLRILKGENPGQEYLDRLEFEINVIIKMGFPSYFLMVADFVNAAKAKGIQVGIGRGSGAGSLVAYSLGITGVDPLEYGLLFERFLNPDRVSMPDFDIDFCALRREEVFDYLRETYGENRTAQIITYMAPKPRGSINMVYQVIVPDADSNNKNDFRRSDLLALTRMIPVGQKDASKSLDQLIKEYPELQAARDKQPMVATLFKYALAVKDIYIQTGIHAAGIILAPDPLVECMPVVWDENSQHCVCGYAMKYAEMAGFVKFDILGLETLTVIDKTTAWIQKRHDKDFDLRHVPLDDENVYAGMAEGLSSGSFQFETAMMKKGLKQIQPTRIHDLIALNALNRPGPMEYIPQYASCKAGTASPIYPAPGTEEILSETYGIMIYQEQIMQIAQKVAGYSLGAADLLRRAMGKKDKVEMDKHRQGFIYGEDKNAIPGCVKLGMTERNAIELFDAIAKFADYGFNKSHAAVYAYLGYWTMWLKVHYPAEFIASQITVKIDAGGVADKKSDAIDNLLNDAKASGLKILPFSINQSTDEFAPEGPKAVRPGFSLLKGITKIKPEFYEARQEKLFTDLLDFFYRGKTFWNKKQLGALIDVGALDELHPARLSGKLGQVNRRQIHDLMEYYTKETERRNKKKKGKTEKKKIEQAGLDFGSVEDPSEMEEPPLEPNVMPTYIETVGEQRDIPAREYAAAGLFISTHPVRQALNSQLASLGVKSYEGILDWRRRNNDDAKPLWQICVMIKDYLIYQPKDNQSGSIRITFRSYSGTGTAYFRMPNQKIRDTRDSVSVDRILKELESAKRSMGPVVMTGRLHESGTNFSVISIISDDLFYQYAQKMNGWVHLHLDTKSASLDEDIENLAEFFVERKAKPNDPYRAEIHLIAPVNGIRPGLQVAVTLPNMYNTQDINSLNTLGGIDKVSIFKPIAVNMLAPEKKTGTGVIPESAEPAIETDEELTDAIVGESQVHDYGIEDAPNFVFSEDDEEVKPTENEKSMEELAIFATMVPEMAHLSTDF
jgi:DNA polymerase-3 subunit alpha